MNNEMIFAHIDHTLLKAFATWEQIQKLCDEAIQYKTASVCVPASYVKAIHDKYGDKINICTVVGFPLGYETTEGKIKDTEKAIEDGANEIDMVINIAEVKNGNFKYVEEEIGKLRKATTGKILKVIIETCYLTENEKIELCKIVTRQNADYIKTSTGFGTSGATIDDIKLFKEHIGENVKIKAAGGIRTVKDAKAYLELGCDRVGASSVIEDAIKGN